MSGWVKMLQEYTVPRHAIATVPATAMTHRLLVMACSSEVLPAIGQLEPALASCAGALRFRTAASRLELANLARARAGALLLEGGARVARRTVAAPEQGEAQRHRARGAEQPAE